MSMVTTVVDLGGPVWGGDPLYEDDTLTFAGAATYKPGTILARNSSTLKLVPFVVGGATGTGTPVAILTLETTAAGAGDKPIRALIRGDVRKQRLIILADGDADNLTKAHIDVLRTYGINVLNVSDLYVADNGTT